MPNRQQIIRVSAFFVIFAILGFGGAALFHGELSYEWWPFVAGAIALTVVQAWVFVRGRRH